MMRTRFAAACATVLALTTAGAHAQPVPARDVRFAFDLGLTGGGDKLATANFNDGTSESIRAGGLVQFGAGVLWQPVGGPIALQATFNYHVDEVNASNGSLRFSRYPVEVLGFYTGLPRFRFGAGPRFVFNPRLKVDVPGDNSNIAFEDTIGAVVEAGYQIGNYMWVNLRLTGETYKIKSINGTGVTANSDVSGNSIGANVVFYF
jgi:hypothetical protein